MEKNLFSSYLEFALAVSKSFSNHSNRLCMSKGANWGHSEQVTSCSCTNKNMSRAISHGCFVSLDNAKVSWTLRGVCVCVCVHARMCVCVCVSHSVMSDSL